MPRPLAALLITALLITALLITPGRLGDIFGDIFGPRKLFTLGVVVFTLGSAASGLAPGAAWLIVAHAVQGLGATLMMPQGLPFTTSLSAASRRSVPVSPYPPSTRSASVSAGCTSRPSPDWSWLCA